MSGLKKIIARHWWVIIAALLIGWFTYWPQVAVEKKLGPAYQGVTKSFIDDDLYYLMRGKEVIDGQPTLANPCLVEHKNGLPMQFWLPDYLLSKPLAIFGVGVDQGYDFYALLLPMIAVLLTYSAIYGLVGSRKLALAGALFLQAILFFKLGGRLPSPGLNFIFWLTLFNLLIVYLKTDKKLCGVLAALNLGLLFYIYPYYWTWFVIFLVLFMIGGKIWLPDFKLFILQTRRIGGEGGKNYLYILLGALLIGARYFWELWQSFKLASYDETVTRLGLLNTHFPSGLKIVILAVLLGILLLWLLRKKIIALNAFFILLMAGVMASLMAVNQHVITGQNLEFSSHYWQVSAFIFVFTLIYCLQFILYRITELKSRKITRTILMWLLIGWSSIVIWQTVRTTSAIEPVDKYRQTYAPVFTWLNAQTQKESVIYANQDLSVYLPIYTANNVYYNQTCTLFFMTDAEVQERFAVSKYFDPLDEEGILKYERSIWGTRYINEYAHNQSKNKLRKIFWLKLVAYEKIPAAEIGRIKGLFEDIKKTDFEIVLKKYRVDYLLWDKNSDPLWQPDRFDFLDEVYNEGNFIIYGVN